MNKIQDAINSHSIKRNNINIDELLPKQIELLRYKPILEKKSLLIWGGTRSGKTVGTCLRSVILAKNISNYTTFCFATTLGQCMLTLGTTIENWLNDLNIVYTKSTVFHHPCIKLENGSVWFFGGYSCRGVDSFAMGVPIDRVIVDEARYLTEEQFGKLYSRLSGTSGKNNVQGIDLITNPEGTDSFLYRYFIAEKKGNSILFPPQDNYKNLVEGYFESLETELPEFMKKRLIYSQWTQAEGSVFEDLEEKDVLFDNFHNDYFFSFGGIDFGFQHNFAFVMCDISQDGYLIIRDSYTTNKTNHETQAQNIKTIIKNNANKQINVYCDHDPQGQMQLMQLINSSEKLAHLSNAEKLHKGDICVFLYRLIKMKKLIVIDTKTNRKLVRQMLNAVWNGEVPLKKEGIEDDLFDTLIYSVSRIYNKRKFLNIFNMKGIE